MSNKPGHRGEREVSRKTIARGMPGLLRCDRGDYARVLCFISHARLRVHRAPGIPCALCFAGRTILAQLGRIAPRDRGVISQRAVIARSKATKQSTLTSRQHGLLRFARNDGLKTGALSPPHSQPSSPCHRARRRRDPVAGYDGRGRAVASLAMTWIQFRILAALIARGLQFRLSPLRFRGRREDRVHAAPAVSCAKCANENAHEHTGSAETLRPSLRNGFTAYFVLSPVNGFLATVASRILPQSLTPAPRRQDHTTSPYASAAFVLHSSRVHRIPPQRS